MKSIAGDDSPPPHFPVACLTSEERDTWASLRQALEANQANRKTLKIIDSAVFIMCLDEKEPQNAVEATRVFLHGDGINRLEKQSTFSHY